MLKNSKITLSQQMKPYKIPNISTEGQYDPQCYKINGKPSVSWKECVTFIKLRQQNCDKLKALNFSKKKQCRIDTTTTRLGPAQCKVIKLRQGDIKETKNGWANSLTIEYELGQPKQNLDQYEANLLQKLTKEAQNSQRELNKYYDDAIQLTNQHTYSLKKMTRQQLLNKLKQLNTPQPPSIVQSILPDDFNQKRLKSQYQESNDVASNSTSYSPLKQNYFRINLKVINNQIKARKTFVTQASESRDTTQLLLSQVRSKQSLRKRTLL